LVVDHKDHAHIEVAHLQGLHDKVED